MKIFLIKDDITKIKTDVIVNAANYTLMGGGGVDGAIHRAAGSQLEEECIKIRKKQFPDGLPTGEVVLTKGYNLPSKYIIHTVGPIYGAENGHEDELLASCYLKSLKLSKKNKLSSIAFPSISTGAFGFPVKQAVKIIAKTLAEFCKQQTSKSILKKIIMVTHSELDFNAYLSEFNKQNIFD